MTISFVSQPNLKNFNFSQKLSSDLVNAYQVLMTKVPRTDWQGLQIRVETAERLAKQAFEKKERAAWEVIQIVEWRLQRQNHLRPTDPGDVWVLETLYAIEETTIARVDLPHGLSSQEFCAVLQADISQYAATSSELMSSIRSGSLTFSDWKYLGYQWFSSTLDFTRAIALASLSLPSQQARLMYKNLYDEVGQGNWERSHFQQLHQFLSQFEIDITDEETMLDWVMPEVLAMTNAQNRLLWNREPGWALGAMFLCEHLLPSELIQIQKVLQTMDLKAGSLDYFHEHIEVDVEHSAEWLSIIEGLLEDYESQKIAYSAAMQQGQWQKRAWDAAFAGWQQWKQTGVLSHLPVAELRSLVT
jgi:pyrroloquinoline quinone (PQQ) biosynthesis protein C